jgi:hypothetical protein
MELECCRIMYFDVCYCRRFEATDTWSCPNCSIKAMVFGSVRVDGGSHSPRGEANV